MIDKNLSICDFDHSNAEKNYFDRPGPFDLDLFIFPRISEKSGSGNRTGYPVTETEKTGRVSQ